MGTKLGLKTLQKLESSKLIQQGTSLRSIVVTCSNYFNTFISILYTSANLYVLVEKNSVN